MSMLRDYWAGLTVELRPSWARPTLRIVPCQVRDLPGCLLGSSFRDF